MPALPAASGFSTMDTSRLSPRQQEILDLITRDGAQQIDGLARRYGLTTQTMRRDINVLCELGHARRLHGGVDLPVLPQNISVSARAQLNSAAKRRIAAWIAGQIPDGATVFLGIGTTVHYVADALRSHSGLTVITNNVDVAQTLGTAPGVELHVTGGIWRANDRDVVGTDAIRFFEKFFATHAVVGAGGLHARNGVLDYSYAEAQVTNAIIENSRTRYLAADITKWRRDAAVRVMPFARFSAFVTDRLPDSDTAEALRDSGIDVVLCGPGEDVEAA
jgi:DeoR family glycerol-3-phosphate regulon repressor